MGAAVDHVTPMGMSGGSAEGNDKSEGQCFSCKSKLTALVVDNGGVCRAIQTVLLRSYGVDTEAVETGEAAVELIAAGATFSLIIIEMLLPFMDGPEVYITFFYFILLAKGPSSVHYLVIHYQLVIINTSDTSKVFFNSISTSGISNCGVQVQMLHPMLF